MAPFASILARNLLLWRQFRGASAGVPRNMLREIHQGLVGEGVSRMIVYKCFTWNDLQFKNWRTYAEPT